MEASGPGGLCYRTISSASSLSAAKRGFFLSPDRECTAVSSGRTLQFWGYDAKTETPPGTPRNLAHEPEFMCLRELDLGAEVDSVEVIAQHGETGNRGRLDYLLVISVAYQYSVICYSPSTKSFKTLFSGSLEERNPMQECSPRLGGRLASTVIVQKRDRDTHHSVLLNLSQGSLDLIHICVSGKAGDVVRDLSGSVRLSLELLSTTYCLADVVNMALLLGRSDNWGNPLLALHVIDQTGSHHIVCSGVEFNEKNWPSSLVDGPWCLRNICPTTGLVLSTVSGNVVYMTSSAVFVSSGESVDQVSIPSAILSAELLYSVDEKIDVLALGDEEGCVHVLEVGEGCKVSCRELCRGDDDTCLSPAMWISWLSGDGVLFLVNGDLKSSLVKLRAQVRKGEKRRGSASQGPQLLMLPDRRRGGRCPIVDTSTLSATVEDDSVFSERSTPIVDMVPVDLLQSGETSFLMASGDGSHRGRAGALLFGEYGHELVRYVEGPMMEGEIRLMGLKATSDTAYHSYLVFAYEDTDCSKVMGIDGFQFGEVEIPGFIPDERCVCVGTCGNFMVQVTSRRVVTFTGVSMGSEWTVPGDAHMASLDDDSIVIAGGKDLNTLRVGGDGSLTLVSTISLGVEPSAIVLSTALQLVGIASWKDNSFLMYSLKDCKVSERPVAHVNCDVTVRSAAFTQQAGRTMVVLGLSNGRAVVYEFHTNLNTLSKIRTFSVGTTQCRLTSFWKDNKEHIYINSSRDAVLSFGPNDAVSCFRAQSSIQRGVHGVKALTPVNTPGLPDSYAWIDHDGQLIFGSLGMSPNLCISRTPLHETPLRVAFNEEMRVAVVVTGQDTFGANGRIRLFSLPDMQETWSMKLEPGKIVTAISSFKSSFFISFYVAPTAAFSGVSVFDIVQTELEVSKALRYSMKCRTTLSPGGVCSALTMTNKELFVATSEALVRYSIADDFAILGKLDLQESGADVGVITSMSAHSGKIAMADVLGNTVLCGMNNDNAGLEVLALMKNTDKNQPLVCTTPALTASSGDSLPVYFICDAGQGLAMYSTTESPDNGKDKKASGPPLQFISTGCASLQKLPVMVHRGKVGIGSSDEGSDPCYDSLLVAFVDGTLVSVDPIPSKLVDPLTKLANHINEKWSDDSINPGHFRAVGTSEDGNVFISGDSFLRSDLKTLTKTLGIGSLIEEIPNYLRETSKIQLE